MKENEPHDHSPSKTIIIANRSYQEINTNFSRKVHKVFKHIQLTRIYNQRPV